MRLQALSHKFTLQPLILRISYKVCSVLGFLLIKSDFTNLESKFFYLIYSQSIQRYVRLFIFVILKLLSRFFFFQSCAYSVGAFLIQRLKTCIFKNHENILDRCSRCRWIHHFLFSLLSTDHIYLRDGYFFQCFLSK